MPSEIIAALPLLYPATNLNAAIIRSAAIAAKIAFGFFPIRNAFLWRAVAGIDQRMNALRNHRSASAAVSCDKFKRGNNQVGGYRSENRFWLFPHTKRRSEEH